MLCPVVFDGQYCWALVCSALWCLMVNTAGHYALTSLNYSVLPPYSLLRLLDSTEHDVEGFVADMKRVWSCVEKLEELGKTNMKVRQFVRDLRFPQLVWWREGWLCLEWHEWQAPDHLL
eukprot:4163241-Amphidinium_carterae.1